MAKKTENLEEIVEPQNPVETPVAEEVGEDVVVSAKDSTMDQTVSAVNSDSAIFNRQGLDVDIDKEQKKQKVMHIVKNVLVYGFLTIAAVLAFLPFYWMIISSVKTEMEYRQSTPTFFPHTFK
ncbi:MAG: hypothetical protein K2N84_03535, partial [Clostridia bacterium]|nr:hypothetical protein [Clostridia bacterium]